MDKEAEDAQAVVHGNNDDVPMSEELAVLTALRGAAGGEAAAVDPDHDGKLTVRFRIRGGPDVESEAVFAGAGVVEDHIGVAAGLHTVRAKVGGGTNTLPFGRRHRWLPAEVANRRRGIRDAFEGDDLMVGSVGALDLALV